MANLKIPKAKQSADAGQVSPAEFDYVAEQIGVDENEDTEWGLQLANAIEARLSKSDFKATLDTLVAMVEKKADRSALDTVWRTVENRFATRGEIFDLARTIDNHISAAPLHGDLLNALNTLASKIDAMKAGLIAHAQKLDTDFAAQNVAVTSSDLDEDYEGTLAPTLI
jgi:hypothetical protein